MSIRPVYLAQDSSRVNFPGPLEMFQGYQMVSICKAGHRVELPFFQKIIGLNLMKT